MPPLTLALFFVVALFTAGGFNHLAPAMALPAFPRAQGFGESTTGGRGGRVIYVTNLKSAGAGSLNAALSATGKRTILFKVSGVIHAPANIVHGDVTIAGQTSPAGIIVRGLVADCHYERNNCDNVIVRHLRSRPAAYLDNRQGVLDDALRLDGIKNFVIDHCSFANASDEAMQVSWASKGTIQNCILAETVGEHAEFGGMLLNYSHSSHPQDYLSIHHNMWHRLSGRMPEITCEASGFPDGPADNRDGMAHPLRLELSNNLLWDPGINIWYTRYIDNNPQLGTYRLQMNWVNNYMKTRTDFGMAMIGHEILEAKENSLYFSGNKMSLYPEMSDYQLAYCCNDFNEPSSHPNTDFGVAKRLSARHPFPSIAYTPTEEVMAYMIKNVGAFPRDAMDKRYIQSLKSGNIDPTPRDRAGARDAFALNFNPLKPPSAPLDTDGDGMPDEWERKHGLNPKSQDGNGVQLSAKLTGVKGYTNLECYLNELGDNRVGK